MRMKPRLKLLLLPPTEETKAELDGGEEVEETGQVPEATDEAAKVEVKDKALGHASPSNGDTLTTFKWRMSPRPY